MTDRIEDKLNLIIECLELNCELAGKQHNWERLDDIPSFGGSMDLLKYTKHTKCIVCNEDRYEEVLK